MPRAGLARVGVPRAGVPRVGVPRAGVTRAPLLGCSKKLRKLLFHSFGSKYKIRILPNSNIKLFSNF